MKEKSVPDKKIAIIPLIEKDSIETFDFNEINTIINPLNKSHKRYWFDANFYKCLPLSIGNMQGFSVSVPYTFDVMWNGGENPEDLFFRFDDDIKNYSNRPHVSIESHFGKGIFTIQFPFMIKTPPNVNIMTISPPNFPLVGVSPMSGVVEADNLRYIFTVNVKVDIPNSWLRIEANYPISCLLPIPRYFCDQFEIIDGAKELDEDFVEEERKIAEDHAYVRNFLLEKFFGEEKRFDRTYFSGTDIRGNKFSNHQIPGIKDKEGEK